MKTSIQKIGTIIAVIVLLPLIIYTVYELTRFSENEEFLENIYSEQLNTIIYSVNQYVDDNLQSWAVKLNDINQKDDQFTKDIEITNFIKSNPTVSLIIIANLSNTESMEFYSTQLQNRSKAAISRIQDLLDSNAEILKSLKKFRTLGYDKVQAMTNNLDETPLLAFLSDDEKGELNVFILAINMDLFVENVLSKKINSVSTEDLIVSIFENENLISYTGGAQVLFEDLLEYKQIWNFPNYYLGISTPGTTIKDLARERTTQNLIILGLLNLVILIGLWFLYRNVRKEIRLSQLKSDFVSNVSHEIRTPLSLIGMFAETLEMHRVESEEQKDEYYTIIRRETERLTRIVNSILNFSKMESQNKKFNFEKINLNDIIDEVLKTYQHEFENGKNECSVTKYDELPELKLDKEAIIEAVMNLMDNALKYCEEKCVLKITTGIKDKFAYLEIADNGIGISRENQKKIFEKFYRVASGNVHNTKGSGLGLSIVKNIMEAHSGTVEVESKLGKGSTFRLLFPLN